MAEVNILQALGISLRIGLPDNTWQRRHKSWVVILPILFFSLCVKTSRELGYYQSQNSIYYVIFLQYMSLFLKDCNCFELYKKIDLQKVENVSCPTFEIGILSCQQLFRGTIPRLRQREKTNREMLVLWKEFPLTYRKMHICKYKYA